MEALEMAKPQDAGRASREEGRPRGGTRDDLFLVLAGRLTVQLRGGDVELGPGELFVVPRGVEHCPRSEEGASMLLVEPEATPNTGDPATAAAEVEL
jgi:mannose-6-phosphate isomerase-like protein (cupin superfamily)